jgi:hypothetical protein
MNPTKILVIFASLIYFKASCQPITELPSDTINEIAFASDTQAPMLVETILHKANHNRTATKMIFNDINELHPKSLFLLGDVVNLGYSNRQWRPMDANLLKLRNNGIMVNAALGNHEVLGQPGKGQRKFQKRFPNHVRTGYVEIVDSIAVILLNSNFNTLTSKENDDQVVWYKKTLEQLDTDSSVLFIITGCHHSPFTDSKIVKPSTEVEQKFVLPFLSSRKSRLFLSGHCHGFEHYQVSGKDFFVIGGGGGLHQPLKETDKEMPDLALNYKPMFHYLTVKRIMDHLEVTSHELKKDFSGFNKGLTLEIIKNTYSSGIDVAKTQTQAADKTEKR